MKWINNSCGCGANGGSHVFDTYDYNFKNTLEKCSVFRCMVCGSLYPEVFPAKESLQNVYNNYYTIPKRRLGVRCLLRKLVDLTRKHYMLRGSPRYADTILDYGCGSGEFLSLLNCEGFDAVLYGTDIFKPSDAVNMVFEWLPLDLLDKFERRYDWITMNHVIEHLASVAPILTQLANVTSRNGSIWISTPNADSILIKCFKGFARDIDFPRHRQIFSKKALKEELMRVGFNVSFLSPPRINVILNFNSCVKNIWECGEKTSLKKAQVIILAGIRMALHLLLPKQIRDQEAPELVLVGSLEINVK